MMIFSTIMQRFNILQFCVWTVAAAIACIFLALSFQSGPDVSNVNAAPVIERLILPEPHDFSEELKMLENSGFIRPEEVSIAPQVLSIKPTVLGVARDNRGELTALLKLDRVTGRVGIGDAFEEWRVKDVTESEVTVERGEETAIIKVFSTR
jgi:hypothetical protein